MRARAAGNTARSLGPTDIVLAPVRGVRLVGRALEDLNTLAERARRDPDPVEEVRQRIDSVISELGALVRTLPEAVLEIRGVTAAAHALTAEALVVGAAARELTGAARDVDATAREIVVGGRDLTDTAKSLDATAEEIVVGGRELTETAKSLDATATDLHTGRREPDRGRPPHRRVPARLSRRAPAAARRGSTRSRGSRRRSSRSPRRSSRCRGAAARVGRVTRRLTGAGDGE